MGKGISQKEIKYQAVESGFFTKKQILVIIKYLETDLEELFWAINNLKGAKLKQKLRIVNREYLKRFNSLDKESQFYFQITYDKLIIFIEDQVERISLIENGIETLPVAEDTKSTKAVKGELTHYEILIALFYISKGANNGKELKKIHIVKLYYYLNNRNPKTTFENSTEYLQMKGVLSADKFGKKRILRKYGFGALRFLESIGLHSVATSLKNDLL